MLKGQLGGAVKACRGKHGVLVGKPMDTFKLGIQQRSDLNNVTR